MAPRKVMKTRNQAAFWLIGCPTPKICGENRLPTLRNVLQHVLFHHNPPSVSIREACGLTADALLPFWVKGGIGTITHKCVVDRLVRVHQEWIELKRSMKRPANKRRAMFIASLDVLFIFASKKSTAFFTVTGISTDFLEKDPSCWLADDDYLKGLKIVRHFRVVNDAAERGVQLVTRFLKGNQLTKR